MNDLCVAAGCYNNPEWQLESAYGRTQLACDEHLEVIISGIYGTTRRTPVVRPFPQPAPLVPRDPPT